MQSIDNSDNIFELASVNIKDYDCILDTSISCCNVAKPQDISQYNTDVDFASNLNKKVERLKFGADIGNTTTSQDNCSLLVGQGPTVLSSQELEAFLSSVLDESQINAVVEAVSDRQSNGATAKHL